MTLPILVTRVIVVEYFVLHYLLDGMVKLDSLEVEFVKVYRNSNDLTVFEIADVIEVAKDVARAIVAPNNADVHLVGLLLVLLDVDYDRLYLAHGNLLGFDLC